MAHGDEGSYGSYGRRGRKGLMKKGSYGRELWIISMYCGLLGRELYVLCFMFYLVFFFPCYFLLSLAFYRFVFFFGDLCCCFFLFFNFLGSVLCSLERGGNLCMGGSCFLFLWF
ncbi:hypothetical protein BZA77DRAFT_329136 [Pyronema omphalodes]|nr:hypothetical protein BZA77DRAFT_329136 [Pyronema omphalodes]